MSEVTPTLAHNYCPENSRAIDISYYGLVAYATGTTLNLTGFTLNRFCPSNYNSIITSLQFHPHERRLAVGEESGQITIINFERSPIAANFKGRCIFIRWFNDCLYALFSNKTLYCLSSNLKTVWIMDMPIEFIGFDVQDGVFFFYTNKTIFSVYKYDSGKKLLLISDRLEVGETGNIMQAQFSHLKGYVLILFPDSFYFYSIKHQLVIPAISQRNSASPYHFFVEAPSSFYIFQRNGNISIHEKNGKFTREIQSKQVDGCFVNAVVNSDNNLYILHSVQGLYLFNNNFITKADLTFPSNYSSVDCDNLQYTVGTSDGFVIIGSIFEPTGVKRFKVSQKPVTFVNISASISKVYWQSGENIGSIDLVSRKVEVFSNIFGGVVRCYGSHRGALIVQREGRVLGIYIDNKEKPLLFDSDIAAVGINESDSSVYDGNFGVLLKNNEVHFFTYSRIGVRQAGPSLKPRIIERDASSFALRGSQFVSSFTSNLLQFCDADTMESSRIYIDQSQPHALQLAPTAVFGLCNKQALFRYTNETKILTDVVAFKVIEDQMLMVLTGKGSVLFLNQDFESVATNYLPVPPFESLQKEFIRSGKEWFDPRAKGAWVTEAEGEPPIQSFIDLFHAGRVEKAIEQIHQADSISLKDALIGAVLLSGSSEKAKKRLIDGAKIVGNGEDAAILNELGGHYLDAIEWLMENDREDEALLMVKNKCQKKEAALVKIGLMRMKKGDSAGAIAAFGEAKEFHPMLQVMMNCGMVIDAHSILTRGEEIKPMSKEVCDDLLPLSELVQTVQSVYIKLLKDLGYTQ